MHRTTESTKELKEVTALGGESKVSAVVTKKRRPRKDKIATLSTVAKEVPAKEETDTIVTKRTPNLILRHDYDRKAVMSEIAKFNADQTGTTVSTYLGDTQLRSTEVSNQYKLFDFKEAMGKIIDKLETHIDIEKYNIKIAKGTQEISLMSAPMIINGDSYNAAFYILNSTDRTRALQFTIGLFRNRDNIEIIMPVPEDMFQNTKFADVVPEASTHRKFVHKGKDFEAKVSAIYSFLDQFPALIKQQKAALTYLATRRISLRKLVNMMLYEGGNGVVPVQTSSVRTQAFGKQIFAHKTDAIKIAGMGISQNEIYELQRPSEWLRHGTKDIEVNAYQALQWYIAQYRKRDVSVIRRECERFYLYVNRLNALDGSKSEDELFEVKYRNQA